MIDVKDLRVGNVVCAAPMYEHLFKGGLVVISAICKDYVQNEEFKTLYLKQIDPIELTPEILEKAGFVKSKTSNEYWSHFVLKNGWHISEWVYERPIAVFEKKGCFYWGPDYVLVKSLHELQNIYYCLNRKELPIQL